MGLFDNVLGGMFGGGQQAGAPSSSMSPMVKALLMLLAAKAVSSQFSHGSTPSGSTPSGTAPQPDPAAGGQITSGILAGLPGLDAILGKLTGAGHGGAVQSWIGHGTNTPIPPNDLQNALGADTVNQLQQESGLPRDQLMSQLSTALPQVVDKMTPDGHLPPADARSHW